MHLDFKDYNQRLLTLNAKMYYNKYIKITNCDFIDSILYIDENRCKWGHCQRNTATGIVYTSVLIYG